MSLKNNYFNIPKLSYKKKNLLSLSLIKLIID